MLTEIFGPALDQLAQNRRPIGEQEHQIRRAGSGAAFLILALGWGAFVGSMPETRGEAARVMSGGALTPEDWIGIGVWAFALVSGILMLLTGIKRSRGPRDAMIAAKALFWIALAAALFWKGAFVPDWPLLDALLVTVYVGTIVSGLTRLILALRGMPELRLPDPEDLGLPVSGPASAEAAAAAMAGSDSWNPPRFRE